ncbi:hypothetical protein LTS10_000133 [Elasticomyces elasticus]|nr:hypothetical protein LTS10_000133 [Elasticomyces elasticus]
MLKDDSGGSLSDGAASTSDLLSDDEDEDESEDIEDSGVSNGEKASATPWSSETSANSRHNLSPLQSYRTLGLARGPQKSNALFRQS